MGDVSRGAQSFGSYGGDGHVRRAGVWNFGNNARCTPSPPQSSPQGFAHTHGVNDYSVLKLRAAHAVSAPQQGPQPWSGWQAGSPTYALAATNQQQQQHPFTQAVQYQVYHAGLHAAAAAAAAVQQQQAIATHGATSGAALQHAQQALSRATGELSAAKSERDSAETKLAAATLTLVTADAACEEAKKEARSLAAQLDAAKKEIATLKAAVASSNAACDSLQDQCRTLDKMVAALWGRSRDPMSDSLAVMEAIIIADAEHHAANVKNEDDTFTLIDIDDITADVEHKNCNCLCCTSSLHSSPDDSQV